jgi:hypothetical protein
MPEELLLIFKYFDKVSKKALNIIFSSTALKKFLSTK